MNRSIAVLAAALALAVSGTAANAASKDSGFTGPKVNGSLKHSLFISGDKEAIRNLKVSSIFCRWIKGHVYLHISFRNRENAHITVNVQPNYRLLNAGLHGDGLTSSKDFGIDGGAFRAVFYDVGTPGGVAGSPRITVCAPEINSVELG